VDKTIQTAYKKTMGLLATEFPGYSSTIDDDDPNIERQSRADKDFNSRGRICICTMAFELLQKCKLRHSIVDDGSVHHAEPKLTSAGLEAYNSRIVDVSSAEHKNFQHEQAIVHENCFQVYKSGGFLPHTLIKDFVSDESQQATRSSLLSLQRSSDTSMPNGSKRRKYTHEEITKRFRHVKCTPHDNDRSIAVQELADELECLGNLDLASTCRENAECGVDFDEEALDKIRATIASLRE
jgi:hypothetical protein